MQAYLYICFFESKQLFWRLRWAKTKNKTTLMQQPIKTRENFGRRAQIRSWFVLLLIGWKRNKNIVCFWMVSKSTFALMPQPICRAQQWQNVSQHIKIENCLKQWQNNSKHSSSIYYRQALQRPQHSILIISASCALKPRILLVMLGISCMRA